MGRRSKMNQLRHPTPDGAWAHATPIMTVEEPETGLAGPSPFGGCPDNIAEMTIQTWLQAGLLIHSGEHIRAGAVDVHGNLRTLQPLPGQEERSPAGTNMVAVLSLFDGTGLARIAVDGAIQDCGDIVLVRSAFVEHDRTLARQVAAVWSNEVHSGRTSVAHTPIACDIWDLCRPEQPTGDSCERSYRSDWLGHSAK